MTTTHLRRDVRQNADAAGIDALHEGERRQRQRRRVEQEAGAFHREAEQPAAVAEQELDRMHRAAHRQHGKGSRRVMLAEIREVRQRRRQKCEHDCDRGADAHDASASRLDGFSATGVAMRLWRARSAAIHRVTGSRRGSARDSPARGRPRRRRLRRRIGAAHSVLRSPVEPSFRAMVRRWSGPAARCPRSRLGLLASSRPAPNSTTCQQESADRGYQQVSSRSAWRNGGTDRISPDPPRAATLVA